MAKVILISPPYVDLYGNLSKAAGRYFPLGIGYIASYLRKYGGNDVQMYEPEAQGMTYADFAAIIKAGAPFVRRALFPARNTGFIQPTMSLKKWRCSRRTTMPASSSSRMIRSLSIMIASKRYAGE